MDGEADIEKLQKGEAEIVKQTQWKVGVQMR
jgi:hypothetical protein